MLRARGRTRSLEGASTISTKEKNIMLSNRRRFLQGAASAKVAPVTLQDRSYEPLKLPRPISLAALTILDVSPANQVLCAAKAGYSHVGIRLVPATPTETQYDMIGNTPMIREVEANLKATGIKVLDIEILRIKPDTRAVNWKAFFETGTRLGATQVLCAGNDPDINRRMELERELENLTFERENLMSAQPAEGQEFTQEELDHRYARIAELRSQELRVTDELNTIRAKGTPQLTMENIARVIEMWTKIPASKIKEEEFKRLAELDQRLRAHVVGQDEAIAAVSAAIRRNRVGISPKHKPVSFIFVGPTGVGKTELVKQLADDLFNAPESLIRLDMSEFMEKHSVSRIVGSPPGYVGYDEAGQLTEKIRRKPYSVVLFDEIEKAHPDVLNVLLQILDDGQITDAHGRKVNFENTVIVMTSNAGSDNKSAGAVGFGGSADQQGKERTMKALQDFLRPEFLNRVDEIICFNHLTKENFTGIARIMLEELRTSLGDKGYTFRYDDALVDYLVEKSYSMTYGARNLRRQIQKELEDPMAARIIDSFENPITQISATAADGAVQLYTL